MSLAPIGEESSALYKRISRNFTAIFSATTLAALLGMMAVAVNARALALSEMGILALVQAYATLISGLSSFNTHLPVMRLGAEAIEQGDRAKLSQLIFFALLFDILAGFLAAGLCYLATPLAIHLFDLDHRLEKVIMPFTFAVLFAGLPSANGILRLIDRFDLLGIFEILRSLSIFILSIIMWQMKTPLFLYFIMYACAMAAFPLIKLVYAWIFITRKFNLNFRESYQCSGVVREIFSFAWTSFFGSSLDAIRNNLDSIVAGSILSKEAIGLYAIAKQTAGILRKFSNFASLISFTEVSRLDARGAHDQANTLILRIVWVCFFIGLLATILSFIFGKLLLSLAFGEQYIHAFGAFVILVCAAALSLIFNVIVMLIQIRSGPRRALYCQVIPIFLFIIVLPIMTHHQGLIGLAVSSLVLMIANIVFGLLAVHDSASHRDGMRGV